MEQATTEIVDAVRGVRGVVDHPSATALLTALGSSVVDIRVMFWTQPRQFDALNVVHEVMIAVKRRLDEVGVEMPAEILALQATSSFAAALRGDPVTPGGAVARDGTGAGSD